jgi:hypothetical protein
MPKFENENPQLSVLISKIYSVIDDILSP